MRQREVDVCGVQEARLCKERAERRLPGLAHVHQQPAETLGDAWVEVGRHQGELGREVVSALGAEMQYLGQSLGVFSVFADELEPRTKSCPELPGTLDHRCGRL